MMKIELYADLFGKLNSLCETMHLDADATAPCKMAEHLREVRRMCDWLSEEADTLSNQADEALDELYDKNFTSGIDMLSKMVTQLDELRDTVEIIHSQLANTLCALRELTAPAGWLPTCTDAQIQQCIDEGFTLTNSMSLGYQNGQYALLFEKEENGEELVKEPFVIGVGREADYEEVRAFVEQFLDMEEWEGDEMSLSD